MCFHSYASRIGSKTLQEELALNELFPFIRFTNWKQELEQEILEIKKQYPEFPFIRFTNWKQATPPMELGFYP